MKFGAVLAPEEIGIDAGATRAYAQAVEGMGFSYIDVLDHVLGADITNRPNWTGAYSSKDIFHEPMVTLGFLAGVTTTIEMFTGVLVLSQRQTALVAKQLRRWTCSAVAGCASAWAWGGTRWSTRQWDPILRPAGGG